MCSGRPLELGERRDRLAAVGGALVVDLEQQRLVATGRSGGRHSPAKPTERAGHARFCGVIRRRRRPSAGRGTPRRWPARSSGRSSSGATGWGRCRRRRWCTASPSRRPSRSAPRSQTSVASPSSDSPTSRSATLAVSVATWRCRSCASWSEIRGVIGCRAISSLSRLDHARGVVGLAGLEDRAQLALELPQQHAVAVGRLRRAATRGRRGARPASSTSVSSALSSAADASAYRMKSTSQVYGRRVHRSDRS